jgi:UDP-2-acetamido-3-amino-2,3-dideoxy-glucuronate N-acetyltransferase
MEPFVTEVKSSDITPGVAVVGSGYWGSNLVRVFYELGALKSICDSDPVKRERLRREFGEVRVEETFDSLLEMSPPRAIVISTPAETHYDLARRALLAGRDVFVEKPLALRPAEGEELVQIANKEGRILMVGHVLLYHPAIVKLKALIDDGDLGRIQYIYSNRLNLGKIRREENILWSFAPHDISIILMLLGEMPKEVSAHGGCYLHSVIHDVTVSTLSFPSGVRAHLFVSWLHPFKEQKLVVVGDRQMAVFDDLEKIDKLRLYPHQIEWLDRVPVPMRADAKVIPISTAEPLKEECRAFLQAVASRTGFPSDGPKSLQVLRVLDACQRSLESGGQVVSVEQKAPFPSYFVHPSSTVDKPSDIGNGTKIWHYSHIMSNARIGENCVIGQNVLVASDVVVGNNVKIQNNVSVYTGVVLEDDVFCGPSVVFTNVNTPRSAIPRKDQYLSTVVKRGATLGANCTVVCGHSIGRYAFVGAGAVVVDDVPDYALVVGNPGKIVGWVCECGIKLTLADERGSCQVCGRQYGRNSRGLLPI